MSKASESLNAIPTQASHSHGERARPPVRLIGVMDGCGFGLWELRIHWLRRLSPLASVCFGAASGARSCKTFLQDEIGKPSQSVGCAPDAAIHSAESDSVD